MFGHSINTASFFSVLIAALIYLLSLAEVVVAQTNTSLGTGALVNNTTGVNNAAIGNNALFFNTTGSNNTATGVDALVFNSTGDSNTAIGHSATVSARNLTNATAIGAGATVNASNKVRLGSNFVTVIEGQVGFTAVSDKTQKENFQPVDGEEVLGKIRGFELSSWNFIGHDPKEFRHYGPMAQDFYAAFGHDGLGQIGSETTINSGDLAGILMIAVHALEKRTAELKQKEARIAVLESRLEALELRKNHSIQLTAEKSLGDEMVDYYSKSKQHH
jgi:trimeric autotransporter adhesin